MAKVALKGDTIVNSTASGHISYENYQVTGYTSTYPIYDSEGNIIGYGGGDPIYGWVGGYKTDATISGTTNTGVSNVFIEGKNPIVTGSTTTENDAYTIPSGGRYSGGAHSGASGSVTGGNGKNVFVNGKSVSVDGASVTTHASTTTTVKGSSTKVFVGG